MGKKRKKTRSMKPVEKKIWQRKVRKTQKDIRALEKKAKRYELQAKQQKEKKALMERVAKARGPSMTQKLARQALKYGKQFSNEARKQMGMKPTQKKKKGKKKQ